MTTKLNLHRIFRSHPQGFFLKIKPTEKEKSFLDQCRAKVRAALIKPVETFTLQYGVNHQAISPKFRVQGSWAYGTCNLPAHSSQEMDLDYGVYLPSKVFGELESSKEAAKIYFETVELALNKLAEEEKWGFDNSKETCIRLKVSESAHLDVPLYVVPDSMFRSFEENHILATEAMDSVETANFNRKWHRFSNEDYIDLSDITTIHMAKRDGSWKSSDCEQVRAWFNARLNEQPDDGKQLRYICRYLKAWRDFTWEKGGPTSILLMVVTVNYYQYIEDRDDEALYHVCKSLDGALLGKVSDKRIKQHEEEDFNQRFIEDRTAYGNSIEAGKLKQSLELALNLSKPKDALTHLYNRFGERMPKDEELVSDQDQLSDNQSIKKAFQGAAMISSKPTVIRPTEGG